MKNFHVPLPNDLDVALRAEAERQDQPATVLARRAIEQWLRRQRKAALHHAIAGYARDWAGSDADLDPVLVEAAEELLITEAEE